MDQLKGVELVVAHNASFDRPCSDDRRLDQCPALALLGATDQMAQRKYRLSRCPPCLINTRSIVTADIAPGRPLGLAKLMLHRDRTGNMFLTNWWRPATRSKMPKMPPESRHANHLLERQQPEAPPRSSFRFLDRWQPDVVCLQETKSLVEDLPKEAIESAGWHLAAVVKRHTTAWPWSARPQSKWF